MVHPKKLKAPFAARDANVYIVLAHKDNEHTYRMHAHVLKHASPWFQAQLQEDVHEVDPDKAEYIANNTGIMARFELVHDTALGYSKLKRMVTYYSWQRISGR